MKYKVRLRRVTYEFGYVEVEAEDESEACKKGEDYAQSGKPIEWENEDPYNPNTIEAIDADVEED